MTLDVWLSDTVFHISIHTSAREVTQRTECLLSPLYNFNPHFRKGSDTTASTCLTALRDFNPHFRKGSDPFKYAAPAIVNDFNPHFRKGSDHETHVTLWDLGISIHTSAREVTDFRLEILAGNVISIHTSAREVTYGFLYSPVYSSFQSTLPQGK